MAKVVCIVGLMLFQLLIYSKVEAETFTDSLQFIIHNEKIVTSSEGKNCLQFDVSIRRPNTNWNDNDYYMGETDFYFSFNENAFLKNAKPSLVRLNSSIDKPDVNGNCCLKAEVPAVWWVASKRSLRLSINQVREDPPKTVKLQIPHLDTCFIATIQWEVASGNYAPQIAWDSTAAGMITMGNNPIIPTWVGKIDKYPQASIEIDSPLPSVLEACEGSDVMFHVNARSTGDNLKYQWRYYDKQSGTVKTDLDMTPGAHSVAGFDYWVQGSGDTLILRHAAAIADSMKFECYVSDAALPASTYKTAGPVQVFLRDSMHVFLSSAKDAIPLPGVSEIGICPTAKNTTVRLYIWGPGAKEAKEIYDLRYSYAFVNADGSMKLLRDTVRNGQTSFVKDPVSGRIYYYKQLSVEEPGEYYVKNVSTSSCYDTNPLEIGSLVVDTLLNNAQAYASYDTLRVKFSTTPDTTLYPRLAVNIGGEVNLMKDISGVFDHVRNLYPAFGAVQLNPDDTTYLGKAAGLDSVIYVRKIDGCEEYSMREVEVINNLYASIKVHLQGPMMESGEMRCFNAFALPKNSDGSLWKSPYSDSASISSVKFAQDLDDYTLKLPDGKWCDWIYVYVRDGERGDYVDSTSALLRQDGVICDTTGSPYVAFKNLKSATPYHIIIVHMNHLSIMSKIPYVLATKSSAATNIDLTDPTNICGGEVGVDPLILIFGKYCMYAGDVDGSGEISTVDVNAVAEAVADHSAYKCDVDHVGGALKGTDKPIVSSNRSKQILYIR